MLWKLVYNDYKIESGLVQGKEQALEEANITLRRFPYATVDFHKIVQDKSVYVESYEMEVKNGKLKGLKKIELYH